MRYCLLALCVLFLAACSSYEYEGKKLGDYVQDPRLLIKDPHFAGYKEKRDALESEFLNKKISYAEYVEKMDELDEQYAREVQERDAIISQ